MANSAVLASALTLMMYDLPSLELETTDSSLSVASAAVMSQAAGAAAAGLPANWLMLACRRSKKLVLAQNSGLCCRPSFCTTSSATRGERNCSMTVWSCSMSRAGSVMTLAPSVTRNLRASTMMDADAV